MTILASIPESATHPFFIRARQNPWLFLPCRSGMSIVPRFIRTRIFVDSESVLLLPPCNISLSLPLSHTHVEAAEPSTATDRKEGED